MHASYLHLHWASFPQAAQRFAEAARAFQRHGGGFASSPTPSVAKAPEPDLGHHGDRDLGSGLIDFAVNVAVASPPAWLLERITARAGHWAGYPDAAAAREALAAHHGLRPEQLLPTAGAAEAFTLVARAFRPRRAVVVHPQFTEPEAALRAAGHAVDRLVLGPENGFRLNVHAVPPDADLVVIGNPTNPTGVLHPAETLAALVGPGRVVMVDEAFMDVTGEAQSLLPGPLEGVLVLRSLTKTFGLAGLRAGYVAGDPELIRGLAAQQTPWSVSTPAIDAMLACCTPEAAEHTAAITADLPARRDALASHLRSLGLRVVDSEAPFLLVETSAIDRRRSIRPALAERGIAVRRGESFPGLSETWIRLAVRDPERHALLIHALEDLIRSNQ